MNTEFRFRLVISLALHYLIVGGRAPEPLRQTVLQYLQYISANQRHPLAGKSSIAENIAQLLGESHFSKTASAAGRLQYAAVVHFHVDKDIRGAWKKCRKHQGVDFNFRQRGHPAIADNRNGIPAHVNSVARVHPCACCSHLAELRNSIPHISLASGRLDDFPFCFGQ